MDKGEANSTNMRRRVRVLGRVVGRPSGQAKGHRTYDVPASAQPPSSPLRFLLADDHDMTLTGLRNVLELQPDWHVCGEARTGLEAVVMAGRLKPDIVIMDISMPELDGLEATRRIHKLVPDTEVLIFTMHESKVLIQEALAAGARGFMLKTEIGRQLVTIVKNLANHAIAYSQQASAIVMETASPAGTGNLSQAVDGSALTPRECEIIRLIAEGKTSKEIATALTISVKTADVHRGNILNKLKIHNVAELVRYAVRAGLVPP